jgi:mono/diheme cytochrome c family protein
VGLPAAWRGLTAIVLCSAALAAVAGCGGGSSDDRLSKEEYLQEFTSIGDDLESSFDELANADVDTNDFEQVADLADQLGTSLEELAGRVDALSPPEEVEESHDKLVAGLEEFAAWAHELADKVRTAPASELVDLLEEFGLTGGFDPEKVPGALKIQEAVEEFEAAGYELGDSTSTDTETETETGAAGEGDPEAGMAVFLGSAGCGGCHTLADAGTSGSIGPNLDAAQPSHALVVERVTNGQGVMPSFKDTLTEQQIQDVAAYVSSATS